MTSGTFLVLSGAILLSVLAYPHSAEAADKQPRFSPAIDLPEGKGKSLLLEACTKCHELRGLSAYKGYWNRQQWGDMVNSMVKNGAELETEQADIVADYLTRFFGPGSRD